MSEWKVTKMKNVINRMFSGGTPTTTTDDYWNGDLPWLSSGETRKKYIQDTDKTITYLGVKESSTKLAKKNSVVIASAGQGKTRGQVSFLLNDMYINQSIISIEANEQYLLPEYLFFNLSSRYDEIRILSDASSSRGSITTEFLNRFQIKLPDVKTQEKIANFLSTYDQLIEDNNRRIEVLEQTAEEIYKEWFVRMRFPGYENTSFIKGIPEGWEVKRVKDLGEVVTGKTPSTKVTEYYGEEVMFVKTPDMHGNIFTSQTESNLSEAGSNSQDNKLLPQDSIMVSCIGTGGVVSINMFPAHTNQQINSIILEDTNIREWAFLTLKSMKQTIELFGATGATMTNLSKGKFEGLKLLYPSDVLLNKFNNITKPMFKELKSIILTNENLKKQRDLLLPRLMNGSIKVK